MSDITELFSSITVEGDPSADTVEADLARGRVALARDHRRRTIRRSMAATTTVAAAAVIAVVVSQAGGPGASHPAPNAGKRPTATFDGPRAGITPKVKVKKPAIKLVAYTGTQLNGFTVEKIPTDWHLSTSTQFALLIDPQGDHDNDPDTFVGKLAVLTSSIDEHGLGGGDKVTVNGQPGRVSDQGSDGIMLRYNDPSGFGVDVQAPAQLHWTDSQIVDFAEGVHVTGNAVHSRG